MYSSKGTWFRYQTSGQVCNYTVGLKEGQSKTQEIIFLSSKEKGQGIGPDI